MAKKDGFRALNVETLGPQIELPRQDKTRQDKLRTTEQDEREVEQCVFSCVAGHSIYICIYNIISYTYIYNACMHACIIIIIIIIITIIIIIIIIIIIVSNRASMCWDGVTIAR
jgi:hypothetical protein